MFKLTIALIAFSLIACDGRPANQRAGFDCDPVPLQKDFDASQYVGKWFEIYRTTNMPFESGTDVTAQYAANPNASIAVHNRQWLPDQQSWDDAYATATEKYNTPGWLAVNFYSPPTPVPGDYRVLETDYKTYTIVYSCSKLGSRQIKYAWILARQDQLDQQDVAHAFTVFSTVGLKESDFHKTIHGCAADPTKC